MIGSLDEGKAALSRDLVLRKETLCTIVEECRKMQDRTNRTQEQEGARGNQRREKGGVQKKARARHKQQVQHRLKMRVRRARDAAN